MATLAVVPKPSSVGMTLYEMEEQLTALADTAELVPEELQQQFITEFSALLTSAVDKRDRVGQFMAHLEDQIAFAKLEITRLQERRAMFERMLERIEAYVVRVIVGLGADPKGKYRKLEGHSVTFSIRAKPPSVEILDETKIPMDYATFSLKLPATLWEPILDDLGIELRAQVLDAVQSPDVTFSRTAIKRAIESNTAVPGASLKIGEHSLVRK